MLRLRPSVLMVLVTAVLAEVMRVPAARLLLQVLDPALPVACAGLMLRLIVDTGIRITLTTWDAACTRQRSSPGLRHR
ncbi:MAG TPA: hypothetical protein VFQ15_08245 [Jiangellaceae bacterium]|nr:hypothetical protein [Jiangellaceae bacterium]